MAQECEAVSARILAIENEVSTANTHEWAGCYVRWSEEVCLSPRREYAYSESGCLGTYGLDMGDVSEIANDTIRLVSRFDSEFERDVAPAAFVRIRWGERHYLVEPEDIVQFCLDTRCGLDALGFLRDVDRGKPIFGIPEVPLEFRGYLPPPSLEGRITWVGPIEPKPVQEPGGTGLDYRYRASIDVGRRQAISVGLTFLPWDLAATSSTFIEVVAVAEDSCEVECSRRVHEDDYIVEPAIGLRLSLAPAEGDDCQDSPSAGDESE